MLCPRMFKASRVRLFRKTCIVSAVAAVSLSAFRSACAQNYATPTLPTIGSTVYDLALPDGGVSGANFDGGATLITGVSTNKTTAATDATDNANLINDAITYASANGGGTIELPGAAGGTTYLADEILMSNNVNLDVATNATLQNEATTDTFISTNTNATGNVEISGGGIINSNATSTSNNKMVDLEGLNNVEVSNVTIENAPNEHLVTQCDSNVTINDVTIQDAKDQANTDGIDFSGTNILIENCNIADGDDDICAKPDTTVVNGITAHTGNVLIQNINITEGHGISIGGQTNAGLNGMYVNNVTETGSGTSSDDVIENGIHLKAGDGTTSTLQNGGPVQNVTFNNFTMTNVDDAIVLSSFYNNGSDNLPDTGDYPVSPTDATEPLWQNITFENIKVNNATGSAAQIYGLDSSPPNTAGLNFENIDVLENDSPWKMYYSTGVYMDGVTVDGADILDTEGDYKTPDGSTTESEEADDTFVSAANASEIYTPPVPEPATFGVMVVVGLCGCFRPKRRGGVVH
jgi:polygalacturonase